MATSFTGKATVHGIPTDGSDITMSGLGVVTFLLDEISAEHNFETSYLKDVNGHDCASKAWNEYAEYTVNMTIVGSTIALAKASPRLPSPHAVVTVTHIDDGAKFASTSVSLLTGNFLYVGGGSLKFEKNSDVTLTGVKLRKYANSDQNTAMTTAIS